MIHTLNGKRFNIDSGRVINEVTYPPYSLITFRAQWASLGITELPDPMFPDPHLFTWAWNIVDAAGNDDGTIIITPRDPAVIAAEDALAAALAQDVTDTTALKAIAKLKTIAGLSPAEIDAYYANPTNNLIVTVGMTHAQLLVVVAEMLVIQKLHTKGLSVLIRRELR